MSSLRAQVLRYNDAQPTTDRTAAALFAGSHPEGTWNPHNNSIVQSHYTSPLVRGAVIAGLTYGAGAAFSDAFGTPATSLPSTSSPLSTLTAPRPEPDIQPEAPPVSIFSDISGLVSSVTGAYNTYQQAQQPTYQPTAMTSGLIQPLTLGALPALGGAVLGGAARMAVGAARSVASSAMTYCRRHPQWCAGIGGSAAVAGLIESGQLPKIKRRRGRGLTPKDLRSFKRVANLIRVFAPTVRRIPARATRTGAHRHG